ncbi:MAG TPA: hypothetical protein DCQ64_19315 [Candidatus Rokubacteria bacterium]|nr:hypothetical protein [Candidatus Rokubacteria bacterium]
MADSEFVDPITGLALGAHAYGIIPAGTVSAAFAARLRHKWGQSGSGIPANALCLRLSEDGGATWRTDLRQFTVAITAVVNTTNDPLYTETVRSLGKGYRFRLAPLRAGCAVDLAITFTPDLRPGGGASQTDYRWEMGLDFEQWEEIALIPDAPSGILAGLGDVTVTEWVTAPTLTNGTDKVTLGDGLLVYRGVYLNSAAGDVALDQNDDDSVALVAGEEYVAVGAVYSDGSIIVMKGPKAAAGSAVQPVSYTDVPVFVARVPYGGVIVTSTLLAVSGRCAVTDTGGLTYSVQPGRAVSPGMLATPATVQTGTLPDESTSIVYLSPSGVANLTAGVPLKQFTTSGGDITGEVDLRLMLFSGNGDVNMGGHTLSVGYLSEMVLSSWLNAGGYGINNLPPGDYPDHAASVLNVLRQPLKTPARLVALAPVTFPSVVTNGDFTTDLTGWVGTNWAQSAGTALHTAGSTDALAYARTVVDATRHRITVTVTGVAGTVTPMVGADAGTPIAAGAGAVTQEILSTAGGALAVSFAPTTDFDGALDNVLIEELYRGIPDNVGGQVVAADDVLLLAAETVGTDDGKFTVVTPGPWTRTTDCADAAGLYAGVEVYVRAGTGGRTKYIQTADITDLATDPQVWEVLAAL